MRNFYDFDMVPLGTEGLNVTAQLGVDKRYKGCHLGAQIIDFVADWFTNDDLSLIHI